MAVHTSPEVISGELRNTKEISPSKNTIYRYIQQDKDDGGALYRLLPHRGKPYKRQNTKSTRVAITDRIGIEERPSIADEKQEPGHFEIDTIAKKLNYGYTDFMSYSIDFRRRILSIKKHEGLSIRETAKRFHIGTTTIVRWTKQIDARPATSRQRKIDKSALERDVEQYPDAYQRERAERFGVCQMAICKALKKLQLTYKKNSASFKSRRRR